MGNHQRSGVGGDNEVSALSLFKNLAKHVKRLPHIQQGNGDSQKRVLRVVELKMLTGHLVQFYRRSVFPNEISP